jgi:hypothetical protein
VLDRAAVRNKQAASALAKVVTGEHPEFGLVVLVKTGEGTVLLKDGLECHPAAV